GSAENIFLLRDGKVFTPPTSDNILEGLTRLGMMELLRSELDLEVVERSIDRSELYIADEIFLCGTGAQISPVLDVDRRPIGGCLCRPLARSGCRRRRRDGRWPARSNPR